MNLNKAEWVYITHRRTIYTEAKAKVVMSVRSRIYSMPIALPRYLFCLGGFGRIGWIQPFLLYKSFFYDIPPSKHNDTCHFKRYTVYYICTELYSTKRKMWKGNVQSGRICLVIAVWLKVEFLCYIEIDLKMIIIFKFIKIFSKKTNIFSSPTY